MATIPSETTPLGPNWRQHHLPLLHPSFKNPGRYKTMKPAHSAGAKNKTGFFPPAPAGVAAAQQRLPGLAPPGPAPREIRHRRAAVEDKSTETPPARTPPKSEQHLAGLVLPFQVCGRCSPPLPADTTTIATGLGQVTLAQGLGQLGHADGVVHRFKPVRGQPEQRSKHRQHWARPSPRFSKFTDGLCSPPPVKPAPALVSANFSRLLGLASQEWSCSTAFLAQPATLWDLLALLPLSVWFLPTHRFWFSAVASCTWLLEMARGIKQHLATQSYLTRNSPPNSASEGQSFIHQDPTKTVTEAELAMDFRKHWR